MTKYTIMSYSQSMGSQVTVEGKINADTPGQAVRKHLKNKDRMVDIEEGQGSRGYYAVADRNLNSFRVR